jgi:secondary thiamine-phosphate synthase enzyme
MRTATNTIEITAERRFAFADLTDELRRAVKDSGVTDGLAVAFCAHTTCALLLNEWEDGALDDFVRRLEELVPGEDYYAHDDLSRRTQGLEQGGHPRPNGRSHVIQMLVGGSSHAIPVAAGEPALGRWQRLILVELDEPKARSVHFQVLGE